MPSKYNSTANKPGKAVKKGYARGGMAHDKRVLRNLDDEVYRIADKERMGGAEGRDARAERGRINREKDYEKRQLNKAEGGVVKKENKKQYGGAIGRQAAAMGPAIASGIGSDYRHLKPWRGATGGSVQTEEDKSDESLGSTKPRGWGKAARGWQGRYDATKRQR